MTGLGEDLPDLSDNGKAVEAMIKRVAKALYSRRFRRSLDGGYYIAEFTVCEQSAMDALESLGIPLSTLAAIVSREWVAVPKVLTAKMQAAAEQADIRSRGYFECPHATIRNECYSGDPACDDGDENNHNCADAIWRNVLDDAESIDIWCTMISAAPKSPEHSE